MAKLLIRGGRIIDPSQGLDTTGDLLIEEHADEGSHLRRRDIAHLNLVHVAMGEPRRIMLLAFLNASLNVGLNWLLRPVFGIPGLALSTSVTALVMTTALYASLVERLRTRRQEGAASG